jgi:hypothetical protein
MKKVANKQAQNEIQPTHKVNASTSGFMTIPDLRCRGAKWQFEFWRARCSTIIFGDG